VNRVNTGRREQGHRRAEQQQSDRDTQRALRQRRTQRQLVGPAPLDQPNPAGVKAQPDDADDEYAGDVRDVGKVQRILNDLQERDERDHSQQHQPEPSEPCLGGQRSSYTVPAPDVSLAGPTDGSIIRKSKSQPRSAPRMCSL
jgi:hypothetical protein